MLTRNMWILFTLFYCCQYGALAVDTDTRRAADAGVVNLLLEDATEVVTGKIISEPPWQANPQLMKQYGFKGPEPLTERTPFTVKVGRVLLGSLSSNQLITVVATTDYGLRYPMQKDLLLFLKPRTSSVTEPDRAMKKFGDWRAVADYSAILEYNDTLLALIEGSLVGKREPALRKEEVQEPGISEPARRIRTPERRMDERVVRYLASGAQAVTSGKIAPGAGEVRASTNSVRLVRPPFAVTVSRPFFGNLPSNATLNIGKAGGVGGEFFLDAPVIVFVKQNTPADTTHGIDWVPISDTFGVMPQTEGFNEILTRLSKTRVQPGGK